MQTFNRIISYPYGASVRKVCKTELLSKCKWLILMIILTKNKTEHNLTWPYIPHHPYRILIIEGSGSGKKNALLNLINNQPDINKIHLYAKDSYQAKYKYLITNVKK